MNIQFDWLAITLAVHLLMCGMYGLLAAFVVSGASTVERWQSDIHPKNFILIAKNVEFTTRGGDLKLDEMVPEKVLVILKTQYF